MENPRGVLEALVHRLDGLGGVNFDAKNLGKPHIPRWEAVCSACYKGTKIEHRWVATKKKRAMAQAARQVIDTVLSAAGREHEGMDIIKKKSKSKKIRSPKKRLLQAQSELGSPMISPRQTDSVTNARDFLEKIQISHFLDNKHAYNPEYKLITLDPSDSIEYALSVLADHNILSAPVCEVDQGHPDFSVDILDILSFILKTVTGEMDDTKVQWSSYTSDIDKLTQTGHEMLSTATVETLINDKHCSKVVEVNHRGNMYQLVEGVFSRENRRAVVINDDSYVVGLVSQSDIISILSSHLEHLGALGNKTIGELKIGCQTAITMSENALAIHAFYLMYFNRVNAIAITDEGNGSTIVANLSASDLRGIERSGLGLLMEPVLSFLANQQWLRGLTPSQPICCQKDTKFEVALKRMGLYRVHRLWITDEGRPVGVLSITDIMKLLGEIEDEEPEVINISGMNS